MTPSVRVSASRRSVCKVGSEVRHVVQHSTSDLDPGSNGGAMESIVENRKVVEEFVSAARRVAEGAWSTGPAPGRWSPAQVAEHIAISYEMGGSIFDGDWAGPRVPGFLRPLVRGIFLRPVLRRGAFPRKAKAPKPFQPTASPAPRALLLDRLSASATAFERGAASFAASGRSVIDHPIFGRLPLADYVRLQVIHTRHHLPQLGV